MYRPLVTYPNGNQAFFPANVVTEADRQAALNAIGRFTQAMTGVTDEQAAKMSPQRIREVSAKVEFFKVAYG